MMTLILNQPKWRKNWRMKKKNRKRLKNHNRPQLMNMFHLSLLNQRIKILLSEILYDIRVQDQEKHKNEIWSKITESIQTNSSLDLYVKVLAKMLRQRSWKMMKGNQMFQSYLMLISRKIRLLKSQ